MKSTNIQQDFEEIEESPKQKKMNPYVILMVGVVATVLVVTGTVWFVKEDPLNIFPGGSDIPAGGFVIINTYTIAQRYFF